MAEETERYRAQVNFQHKFVNVKQQFDRSFNIFSPTFFARNIPFYLNLHRKANEIFCDLVYGAVEEGCSLNTEYQFFIITPSKTSPSKKLSSIFNKEDYFERIILPDDAILVDDTITLGVSLWADEPQGMMDFNPPKEKLRQDLQISENQVQEDAFSSLWNSGDFSDVTFVTNVDSSKVKAHKAILVARSQVFALMLSTDMKEANDNEIRIDDMGGDSLKILLHHIYTGNLEFPKGVKIDLKICQELVNAGEKYDLKNLKEYAAMAMTEFVLLENAWDLLMFAKGFKAEAATKTLTTYYAGNVLKIIEKA